MKIYLASSLDNVCVVQQVRDALLREGHTISYDWTAHGRVKGNEHKLAKTAIQELRGVEKADAVFVLLPGAAGTHTELGYALAKNIPVFVFGEESDFDNESGKTTSFYFHPGVVQRVVCHTGTVHHVLLTLRQLENKETVI